MNIIMNTLLIGTIAITATFIVLSIINAIRNYKWKLYCEGFDDGMDYSRKLHKELKAQ